MPARRKSGSAARPVADSGDHRPGTTAAAGGGGRRRPMVWPVLFGLFLAFLAGAIVILWPLFRMGGMGVALGMVAAVLVLSLTPLLLLRGLLRRAPASGEGSKEEIR